MTPANHKRRFSSRNEESSSNKKRKTGKSLQSTLRKAPRKVVPLDKLGWKEVPMPDHLDDAEGFYGLEEIDDVDVVRDDSGRISFQISSAHTEDEDKKSKAGNRASSVEEDDEEWGGFDDEEIEALATDEKLVQESKSIVQEQKKTEQKKVEDKKQKQDKKQNQTKKQQKLQGKQVSIDDSELRENVFAELEDDAAELDATDVSAWQSLPLSPETLLALSKLKFSKPTPIQSSAITEIIAGHDVIGKASTGSGKTLAYGIPILEEYLKTSQSKKDMKKRAKQDEELRNPPIALVFSPTRELAHQISAHLTALCSNSGPDSPSIATLTGGLSVQKQRRHLSSADVVIGTPGRLYEVISGGQGLVAWLKKVKFIVVDEADRLLSEGHFKEMEQILDLLDRKSETIGPEGEQLEEESDDGTEVSRQTLVFSATFHKGLQQKLAGKGRPSGDLMSNRESMEYLLKKLNFREEKPKFVDVNPISQMAEGLKEGLVECGATEKDLYLYALLLYYPNTRTLIFTNSISAVRRLTPFLQNLNLPALALHSQMPQKARLRSVERFSSTDHPGSILIATDVAARGLDIKGVQLVIHYHLPRTADMYVHRSGRTARASTSGSSVLLCAPEEVVGVRRLVGKVHAEAAIAAGNTATRYFMRSLDIDRRIAARLKPRVSLAKELADSNLAKEKKASGDDWLRNVAEELGVDYDSDTFQDTSSGKGSRKGRGSGREKRMNEASAKTKAELQALRAELKSQLSQRVNIGVSERYLTDGRIDVNELLKAEKTGEFLGKVDDLGFED
ncbi:P-loop containing nucleoside triphosphate hydrolase protein [Xylona heveae TC161]|uniref:ATP-dependent RNA helicase n=1 Tax=Xylona heveae (strain CBS 132557 / TC161) TaxID=1328760 RepID=A0A165FK27_XYLHT|nr:P-loop containing nucleoside triphosphate hydrolase protein [Xylona heveae TC161]KZF21069.1 P-loop containing nucleoside triphosphate hydrolase protein [Xylona heveae TC161]